MKISLNWLAKYIDLPDSVTELEKLLTFAGIEVEGVKHIPALQESVFSARIVSAEADPKSDHLHCCKVDIGDYPYNDKTEDGLVQVICGAPNCHAGMMALIAMPGTVLPEFTIAKAKIRGVESHGMLCSEKELGISDNHAGIIELPEDTAIGLMANELYELPDTIFELEITPNRPDLLGYIGIARDLSAKLNIALRLPVIQIPEPKFPAGELPLTLVNEDTELCPRYTARLFRNVHITQSPLWLKRALIKSGLRPINNLVDITNFVLLEYGHPLHAFDYDKLAPLPSGDTHPAIVIRKAIAKEPIMALDGKSYNLDGDELVIADGEKASALAGVMGGNLSAISDSTTRIVLESAAFHPGSVRKTSYKHKISTDSSYRFERHLSDHATTNASLRATQLICELAQAELCEAVYDDWQKPTVALVLGIRPARYEQVIGYYLDGDTIKDYLEKLGLRFIQYGNWKPGAISDISEVYCHHGEEIKQGLTEFSEQPDCIHTLYFEIPTSRVDLEREIDLIEELARLDGYDKVPVKTLPGRIMDRHAYKTMRQITDYIVSRGCFETLNYSFTDPDTMAKLGFQESDPEMQMIRLRNPQSGTMSVMRTSLIPQLLQNLVYNLNRGERNVKLFELGKTYFKIAGKHSEPMHLSAIFTGLNREENWQDKSIQLGATTLKGILDELFLLLGVHNCACAPANRPFLNKQENASYTVYKQEVGYFGKLSATVAESFGIDLIELKQDLWILHLDVDNIVEITRNRKMKFSPIPRYPAVTRDISFLIADNVGYSEIEACVKGVDCSLIEEVKVFDEYRGKQIPAGHRSLSIHVKFQDTEKTLTDERIDHLVDLVKTKLTETWQINLR
ncbi:MAG: phenylalanine--tRNA ligase subunit beta [Candidatus Cloacimonetes bacterium HGW-Cloacimonetes-3]|jgi:phenylalanyl-tRNA synthetase beta chain|nr:MAG: phenylalanine--tRNA ligase subunit beta [Candidatus Cloacimonetes bacterium HGW-Cloacimonetes-3]